MSPHPFKLLLVLTWAGVLVVGTVVGGIAYRRTKHARLEEVQANAERCAIAFDGENISALDGSFADVSRVAYSEITQRLVRLREVDPRVRRVALLRVLPGNYKVIFLADSVTSSAGADRSPQTDSRDDSDLEGQLRSGGGPTERTLPVKTGVLITAFANLRDPRAAGGERDMLVLQVEARHWNRGLWDAAGHTALYVWLLLGVPLAFFSFRGRATREVERGLESHERHQEQLRAAKEQAEAGDRAKGQFLATMSHEVKTPVHGIVGFTNLLLETPLTPEQREYVQTIRSSGEALVQLTGDILDFSRIETGGVQLEASACNLRVTLEDALDIFAARAAERGIELLHWIEPDVPTEVILDGGRLRQVLVNLIGNGIKFTPRGEVEVTVRVLTGKAASIAPFDLTQATGQMVAELDDGSLTLEFAVRDTGIGVAPTDRPKLFQPFTQLDASSVRRYGGAGLGLAISRNLVRLMSGDIWLESEPGKGSTFYFTVRGRPPPKPELPEPPPTSLTGRRIAVVAARPRLQLELESLVRHAGASVISPSWSELNSLEWDAAVVDCVNLVSSELQERAQGPGWRPDRTVGLVGVTVSSAERQLLRPHLRTLMSKPVHHRALLNLLARATTPGMGSTPAHEVP